MTYLMQVLGKYASSQFWLGFLSAAVGAFMSFMAPVWAFVFMAFVLVVVDFITGIRAAKKRGEKIRSRGLYRSIEKFALYFIAIAVSEHMSVTFFPSVPVTEVVSFGICITEFFSFAENVETVTGVNIVRRVKKVIPGLLAEEE